MNVHPNQSTKEVIGAAIEVHRVAALTPIDDAQLLTYLRLGGWAVGLLINFNVPVLREGIRRKVFNLAE